MYLGNLANLVIRDDVVDFVGLVTLGEVIDMGDVTRFEVLEVFLTQLITSIFPTSLTPSTSLASWINLDNLVKKINLVNPPGHVDLVDFVDLLGLLDHIDHVNLDKKLYQ